MLRNFMLYLNSMLGNKKGQGMVEYILIIVLIAIVVIAIFPNLTAAITAGYQQVIDAL